MVIGLHVFPKDVSKSLGRSLGCIFMLRNHENGLHGDMIRLDISLEVNVMFGGWGADVIEIN